MSPKLAGLDRVILILVGLIAVAAGAWTILTWIGLDAISDINARLTLAPLGEAPAQSWYQWVLLAVAIVGIVFGLWLVLANLRRRGFNRVRSAASSEAGFIELALGKIAGAVDAEIADRREVIEASHRVAMDRNRPTIAWTITARPGLNVAELTAFLQQVEDEVRDAIDDIDVDTVYRLHLRPVQSSESGTA